MRCARFGCPACGANGIRPADTSGPCQCGADYVTWPAGDVAPVVFDVKPSTAPEERVPRAGSKAKRSRKGRRRQKGNTRNLFAAAAPVGDEA